MLLRHLVDRTLMIRPLAKNSLYVSHVLEFYRLRSKSLMVILYLKVMLSTRMPEHSYVIQTFAGYASW